MFLLASMGPPGGGRTHISRRLQSRFNLINMTFPQVHILSVLVFVSLPLSVSLSINLCQSLSSLCQSQPLCLSVSVCLPPSLLLIFVLFKPYLFFLGESNKKNIWYNDKSKAPRL